MEIKIGCDPEFFVKKDGKYVSAYGLVAGTKANPLRVEKGAVQVDGMALEFNIDPATTSEEFLGNIKSVMQNFREMIPEEYTFAFDPVADFGKEYIDAQPIQAKMLGCDPDYNAYTGLANPKPDGEVPFRTASGHIHIGWTEDEDPLHPEHFEACCMLVKQIDYSIGRAEKFWDKDEIRKKLYGAPGAFRPKSYGVEYRVFSNAWLKDDNLIRFVFDGIKHVTTQLLDGTSHFGKNKKPPSYGFSYDFDFIKRNFNSDITHGVVKNIIRPAFDEFYNDQLKREMETFYGKQYIKATA